MSVRNAGTAYLGDLRVPRFGYGAMRLPGLGVWVPPPEQAKVQRIGPSPVPAEQLSTALCITPLASVSNNYSDCDRGDDAVLARCAQQGIAYLPYFPRAARTLDRHEPVTNVDHELDPT